MKMRWISHVLWMLLLGVGTMANPSSAEAKRTARAPIVCLGNSTIVVRNKIIQTRGVAIKVIGNCDVKVFNSRIIGGKVAIKVLGNGDVYVQDSEIRGKRFAVLVMGRGDVYDRGGNRFFGKISVLGQGTFHRFGKPTRRHPRRVPGLVPPPVYKRAAPLRCTGAKDITLRNRWIRTKGDAIVVTGSCDVKLINCWILAKGVAIKVTGSGDIKIINSTIRGRRAAFKVTGSGDISFKNSVIYGRFVKTGAGDFKNLGGNVIRRHWEPMP